MPGIVVKPEEPLEKILRYFKKQVEKAGVIGDLKKREHYEKPSAKRHKAKKAAEAREARRQNKQNIFYGKNNKSTKTSKGMERPRPR